ncbi:MAG: RNA degradosome polyphosphate kinase [Bacteroidota bacterium]|nr:RNA degradosome polyphosphate kinase [Bacteroidota bacterium]
MKNKVKKNYTVNRDISWMYFNRRILDEASNRTNPLLERLSFLGIYSNNLDEFFQIRIATLRRMSELEENMHPVGTKSGKILKKILKLNEEYTRYFEAIFLNLKEELQQEGIFLVNETQLTPDQERFIDNFYKEELMNSLFPILVSRMAVEPKLNDKSIYLAVKISNKVNVDKKDKKEYALIEVPTGEFSRFLVLPGEGAKNCIMFLDDVIRYCLPRIFAQLNRDSYEAYTIKFTRDAEMEFDNTAYQGVLEKVSKGVKSRKSGLPIRFVYDRDIPADLLRFTGTLLKIGKNDVHVSGGRYHNLKDLTSFPTLNRPELNYINHPPIPVRAFEESISLIALIRKKDQYIHCPYHSFDNFIRLLRESAINPEVKAIKISLYRLARNSKVIKALICAAMNGKKVTAIVELLARFDESSNISWANKMQEAGIKVILGVEGLKVHSKLTHISSRKGNIACIGTGNFHEGTASVYTDFTLMTARKEIVDEVESVFAFLEQPYLTPTFKQLIVAPQYMRKKLMGLIKTETDNARKGKPAYITCIINHLVDEKIIEKLYLASNAGVVIKLLVRGNCSLVTGIPGQSENIQAFGIIDRYLEHSRILIFANGGNERYFIGSADWMVRNLDYRVEVYAPVYDPDIQKQLKRIIEFGLKDNVKARIVDGSGNNLLKDPLNKLPFRSQEELYQFYKTTYEAGFGTVEKSDQESSPLSLIIKKYAKTP